MLLLLVKCQLRLRCKSRFEVLVVLGILLVLLLVLLLVGIHLVVEGIHLLPIPRSKLLVLVLLVPLLCIVLCPRELTLDLLLRI